jgi:hypothetical protein
MLTLELSAVTANGILKIDDQAQLAGTLDIQLAPGFNPALNDAFHLMTGATSITGQFDSIQLPTLSPGLAWQLLYFPSSVTLQVITGIIAGDYNHDGIIDAGDYTVWRDSFGRTGTGLAADGNNNGQVDVDDYSIWKNNFGAHAGSGSGPDAGLAVPEPTTLMMLMVGIWTKCCRKAARYRKLVSPRHVR